VTQKTTETINQENCSPSQAVTLKLPEYAPAKLFTSWQILSAVLGQEELLI
jgi:hypothetical protein